MESLEQKLNRLSPEQRQEIEDFADFLLSRAGAGHARAGAGPSASPVPQEMLPPLILPEPVRSRDPGLPRPPGGEAPGDNPGQVPAFQEISGPDPLTSEYLDYAAGEAGPSPADEAVQKVKRRIIARQAEERPKNILDWVD